MSVPSRVLSSAVVVGWSAATACCIRRHRWLRRRGLARPYPVERIGLSNWRRTRHLALRPLRRRDEPIRIWRGPATARDAQPFARQSERSVRPGLSADVLIDRVADDIRPGTTVSGALRDDLVFVRDRELDRHVATYVAGATASSGRLEMEATAILLVSHLLRVHRGFSVTRPLRAGLAPGS